MVFHQRRHGRNQYQPMTNATNPGWVIGGVLQPAISSGPSATFVVDNKVNLTMTEIIGIA